MCALDRLANALQSVVGAPSLLTEAAAAEYAIDGLPPALVAFPADEAEAAAVLRLANEHQVTVFPRGSGSYLELGNTPERVEVVLSLQRLQRQLAYEPADMTTTVQAGLRLADLQQVLSQHGQYLALDPAAAATATVGGIVATNRSGPQRLLYGTARDLLLGTTVLSIDGKRTKAGGRVVKNVTGYDLNKLYIGSLGTLAVLVELTFKLHPLPPGEHTVGIGFMHHGDMLPLLQTVMQLPLRLSSLALLNAAASTTVAQHADWSAPDSTYLLLTRLEGPPQVTQKQERRLLEALRRLSLQGTATTYTWDDEAPMRVWHAIAEFPITVQAAARFNVVSKVSLLMSDLPAFFQDMQTLSANAGTAWPICAQAGSGIAYVGMSPGQHAATNGKTMLEQIQGLDACVTRLHGRRVIERAPVEVKRHCDVWGTPADDFALMRAIKKSFDPHNRLNPGRFLGGL